MERGRKVQRTTSVRGGGGSIRRGRGRGGGGKVSGKNRRGVNIVIYVCNDWLFGSLIFDFTNNLIQNFANLNN